MNRFVFLLPLLTFVSQGFCQTIDSISEKDYLTDMPVVLSVSRLSQRLDETPGAVTIVDRDMIRRSGARDVADLLRLVPGFQTSTSFESVAPLASYHGAFDNFSNRIELRVDGRSAYSPFFIGSIGPGLQTVALEDIERIEVLRGSNSAAYGARAILGLINIVTRHSADTLGTQAAVAVGENGIRDAQARIGWGGQAGTFRLDVDRRADAGLNGANGMNQINRVNFRSDMSPRAGDELQLRLGGFSINSGKGFANDINNLTRPTGFDSAYVQGDYKRSLSAQEDMSLHFSHSQEAYQDQFPFALQNIHPAYGPNDIYTINAGGQDSIDVLSFQHNLRPSQDVRLVWGSEWRSESVQSMGLYNSDAAFVTEFTRLFGNLEWRAAPQWVMNAGGLFEHSSVTGDTWSPRLMANWHLASGQTLRVGASQAFRPPSTFEKFANLHFIWPAPAPFGFDITNIKSTGQVQPESVLAKEIGYLGEFPQWKLGLDLRLFHEQINGFIRRKDAASLFDYANDENFAIQGWEYQLKWQPWTGAQLILNQAYTDIGSVKPLTGTVMAAPRLASSIAYFQKFANGLDVTLTHQDNSPAVPHNSNINDLFPMTRTDLRLAWPFRMGNRPAEAALVVQNLGLPYQDFDQRFWFMKRAFVTLRVGL